MIWILCISWRVNDCSHVGKVWDMTTHEGSYSGPCVDLHPVADAAELIRGHREVRYVCSPIEGGNIMASYE